MKKVTLLLGLPALIAVGVFAMQGSFNASKIALADGPTPFPRSIQIALADGPTPFPRSVQVALADGPTPFPRSEKLALADGPTPFPRSGLHLNA